MRTDTDRSQRKQCFLRYFQRVPNCGDRFATFLADHYFPCWTDSVQDEQLDNPNLILIGSILSWADARSLVGGAGLIHPQIPLAATPAYITFLRGPLTARALESRGIDVPNRFADSGILAPRLFPRRIEPRYPVGIVPHYVDQDSDWVSRWSDQGIRVLDVGAPLDEFMLDIQSCELILSSSLHGIVFAHAFGRQALWIELSDCVLGDGFKFYDYYTSLGIEPADVPRVRIHEAELPSDLARFASLPNTSDLSDSAEEGMILLADELSRWIT